jgi:hypothetical protein
VCGADILLHLIQDFGLQDRFSLLNKGKGVSWDSILRLVQELKDGLHTKRAGLAETENVCDFLARKDRGDFSRP